MCAERYGWTQAETLASGREFMYELTAYWDADARESEKRRKKQLRTVAGGNLVSEDVDMSAIPWADEGWHGDEH